jgi:hypothetical protein
MGAFEGTPFPEWPVDSGDQEHFIMCVFFMLVISLCLIAILFWF